MTSSLKFDKKRTRARQCPCGKSNKDGKFSPYTGYENKGFCHSCGKTFLPEKSNQWSVISSQFSKAKQAPSFIPYSHFEGSLKHYGNNMFCIYLNGLFGDEVTQKLIKKYCIGTSKRWNGATVFWQIYVSGNIRAGKIMLYNPSTGKRIKEPCNCITWVHTAVKMHEFTLKQCFFGEHLLPGNTQPVAVVESEKTAIISSVYLPEFSWLAAGSLSNITAEKCKVLKGRNVTLFPDLNGFKNWTEKAAFLNEVFPQTHFRVSDLLERKASPLQKEQGLDLADYLILTQNQ